MDFSKPKIDPYEKWKKKQKMKKKNIYLAYVEDRDESSTAESEDYADIYYESKKSQYSGDWPEDYWHIAKLAKPLKIGSPTFTTIALICLRDVKCSNPVVLQALKDNNVINIALNLLECQIKNVQLAALSFIINLGKKKVTRFEIVYFGGLQPIIELLWYPSTEIRTKAAEAITLLAVFHRAWKIVRKCRGVQLLANLLHVPNEILNKSPGKLTCYQKQRIQEAVAGARALFVICENRSNRVQLWKSDAFPMCGIILKCKHSELLTAVIMLMQQCAQDYVVRMEFRKSTVRKSIYRQLISENPSLMQVCAQVVFRCAEDSKFRDIFGKEGFIEKFVKILDKPEYHKNQNLMYSVSGALWRCCKSLKNATCFQEIGGIPIMIQLLPSQPIKVQVHIVSCLATCMQIPLCCTLVRKYGGIDAMVALLQNTYPPLIKKLSKAIAEASNDNESMMVIDKLDAIRLVWSHLQNENPFVITSTTWNLRKIVMNIKDSVIYVRTLIGGLELIVNHLSSPYTSVLTPICALIVEISKQMENLAILTDYHIVERLSKLTNTKCKRLRYYLCMAIAACAPLRQNRNEFGDRKIVYPLIKIFNSKIPEIQGAACHALQQMSIIPKWCAVIHQARNMMSLLFKQMNSDDPSVQESAALILQRMRYFSLTYHANVPHFMDVRMIKLSDYTKY